VNSLACYTTIRRSRTSQSVHSMRTARRLLTAAVLILAVALSAAAGQARDLLAGDVERVKMLGFTAADLDRQIDFL
jgi:hypothetical protein